MFERTKGLITKDRDQTIILDCWNGFERERKAIIVTLKRIGVDKIYCIQFLVSPELNLYFALRKPEMKNYSEGSIF